MRPKRKGRQAVLPWDRPLLNDLAKVVGMRPETLKGGVTRLMRELYFEKAEYKRGTPHLLSKSGTGKKTPTIEQLRRKLRLDV